jgi:trigger factor
MNVTETAHEGLSRSWRVVVPATEIGANVDRKLAEISKTIKLPGFRPGKVPMSVVKKRYGQSVMGEVLEQTVQDSSSKLLDDNSVRPALQPKIEVVSFDGEGSDLEYTMAVEALPEIEPADVTDVKLERVVAAVEDKAVDEAIDRIANNNKSFEPVKKKRAAKEGDQLVIDFAGKVDGEARPGMDGQDYPLELGTGSFIPGFEEQLIGIKPGEVKTIEVTFPEQYHAEELAGKKAEFEVTAKELRAPAKTEVDDEFAKKLGLTDLEALKKLARDQIEGEYGRLTRLKLKRSLMDALAERHDFPVPQGMVDLEFEAIWKQVQPELTEDEKKKPEDELKAEYRAIAERRVRLGLLLSEIGKRNSVQVTQEELNRGLIAEARRFPGQEREVLEAYRNNPRALDSLRAPIYEDKVVDHILGTVTLTDRSVTPEELAREDEETL